MGHAASRSRLAARLALWTAAGLAAGLVLAVAAPFVVGHRSLTVLSGSMEPALHTGDVIVVKRIEPREARVGNIVTYRDARGALITHRVRRVRLRGERVEFITKGDANNAPERWAMRADGEISRVVYRVPMAGHAVSFVSSQRGRLLLVVLPLALLGFFELVSIWRPCRDAGGEAAGSVGAAPAPRNP